MLSKIIRSVTSLFSSKKRPFENSENEYNGFESKRARMEVESDSTSSWCAYGDTCTKTGANNPVTTGLLLPPLDGSVATRRFDYGSVTNASASTSVRGDLFSQPGKPIDVTISSQRHAAAAGQCDLKSRAEGTDLCSRETFQHGIQHVSRKSGSKMIDECIKMDDKEAFRRLIKSYKDDSQQTQPLLYYHRQSDRVGVTAGNYSLFDQQSKNKSRNFESDLTISAKARPAGVETLQHRFEHASNQLRFTVAQNVDRTCDGGPRKETLHRDGENTVGFFTSPSGGCHNFPVTLRSGLLTSTPNNVVVEQSEARPDVRKTTTVDRLDEELVVVADPSAEQADMYGIRRSASTSGLSQPVLRTRSSADFLNKSRSPTSVQWEKDFKESKYAQEDFLQKISTRQKSEDNWRRLKENETKVQFFKQKRLETEEQLAKRIERSLSVSARIPVPIELPKYESETEAEEEQVDEFPELSDEQQAAVQQAMRPNPPSQVLVEGFKLQLTRQDIATLSGLNWLNDESLHDMPHMLPPQGKMVINFYMNLLIERGSRDGFPSVYAFNTFFYPKLVSGGHSSVKRWTKQVDLFTYDFILVPVHLGVHWCLAVIDFREKEIRYYDSMGSDNDKCLNALRQYLESESQEKKKSFSLDGWKSFAVKDIPQQMNGSDCGMFACKFAEYITRRARITFNQTHMPYFRRRMVHEILSKQLM